MRLKMKLMIRIFVLLVLSSCGGDNTTTGNPLVSLSIKATAPSSTSMFALSRSNPIIEVRDQSGAVVGSIQITDARLSLEEIEFGREDSLGNETEVDFEGPFVVDLLLETVTPSLNEISLESGVYNEVEIAFNKVIGDELDEDERPIVDVGDPLFNNSVYVEGLYTGPTANEGNVTEAPFSVSFDLDEEFELTGENDESVGFEVTNGELNSLILAFRLNKWFRFNDIETNEVGVEPSDLILSSGSVALDENSVGDNLSIRQVIINNIRESLDYGKDLDGDGELSSDEDDDPEDENDEDE
jgi:hypothetical protein